ncbi:IcmT/TraK family protein [Propionivibrio sp.]|uniref:IcmT/TraK family protein n=1 Tax=Propionivibrio sp. TaxID=2212460 RepID=UPI00260A84F9|nr:IcmT/TraK family protein [Propionivibrio sp.]
MDIHWRNTQKPARFFILDARAFLAFLLFLVHMRLWTLYVVIAVMFFFWLMERFGLTFEASLRAVRSWFLGQNRPANSRRARRRWIDFG